MSTLNDAESYGVAIEQHAPAAGETYYKVISVHHMTGDENDGRHNLYMDVLDEDGNRINGAILNVLNADGTSTYATIDKPAAEPGTNVAIWKNDTLSAWVSGSLLSDVVSGISTKHADEESGNTLFHHSFYVKWRKTLSADQVSDDTTGDDVDVSTDALTAADRANLQVIIDAAQEILTAHPE